VASGPHSSSMNRSRDLPSSWRTTARTSRRLGSLLLRASFWKPGAIRPAKTETASRQIYAHAGRAGRASSVTSLRVNCAATCDVPCKQGSCVRPNYCECEPGWIGKTCDQFGRFLALFTLSLGKLKILTHSPNRVNLRRLFVSNGKGILRELPRGLWAVSGRLRLQIN